MTTAIPWSFRLRQSSWHLLVLLPVVPFLVLRARRWEGAEVMDVGSLFLLLVVGGALALGLSSVVASLGTVVRKEIEALRGAWLVSIFGLQAVLGTGAWETGLDVMLFAATCALLAGLAFGMEFQQRTLAGLLSQPLARTEWWRLKMRVLTVAVVLHWFLFLLACWAMGRTVTPLLAGGTLIAAGVACGTTPWWTLVTRGLLAGLVFSQAVPLLALTGVAAIMDVWGAADIVRLNRPVTDPAWFYALLFVVAPLYALAGGVLGQREWRRLEAPDQALGESGVLGLPILRLPAAARAGAGRGPRWWFLVSKELRLQSMTLILVGVAMVMASVCVWAPVSDSVKGYQVGSFVLVAMAVVVLAGATTVAEERRLGTLDGQVLSPVSRQLQWWVKLGVAFLLALAVTGLAYAVLNANSESRTSHEGMVVMGVVLLSLFVPAVLASSGATNTLRAMIGGFALAVCVVAAAIAVGYSLGSDRTRGLVTVMETDFAMDPDGWKAAAASLSLAEVEALQARVNMPPDPTWSGAVRGLILGLPVLAVGIALVCAWRNFRYPADAPRRLPRQLALSFGALVILAALSSEWLTHRTKTATRDGFLFQARRYLDVEASLSSAQKRLLRSHQVDPLSPSIFLPLAPVEGARPTGARSFALPLHPTERRLIIERGRISSDVREALLREALDAGETTGNTPGNIRGQAGLPEAIGRTPFAVEPELMRRYGLTLDTNAAPEGVFDAPSRPGVSPPSGALNDLRKRYGIAPAGSTSAAPSQENRNATP